MTYCLTFAEHKALNAAVHSNNPSQVASVLNSRRLSIPIEFVEHVVHKGFVECLKILLAATTTAQYDCALQAAAKLGRTECVALLIEKSDPCAGRSAALGAAAEHGHVECLKLLIPVSQPAEVGCQALAWAARMGHIACVELLMGVSTPEQHHIALCEAAWRGQAECVELLIPNGSPRHANSAPLQHALLGQRPQCVEVLVGVSDVGAALACLHAEYGEVSHLWETFETQWSKSQLTTAVATASEKANRAVKKM